MAAYAGVMTCGNTESPMLRFDGQVAIVTGAGRGMGRSHALDLARRGATVIVSDIGTQTVAGAGRDSSVAKAVVDEILAFGGKAMADATDVANASEVDAMVAKAMSANGRIDILINNAGNQRFLHFAETSRADYDSLIDIHLGGTFNVTRACWPHMAARRYGRVVFTTSQVGFYGQVDAVAYGAAKGGILGLMNGINSTRRRTVSGSIAFRPSRSPAWWWICFRRSSRRNCRPTTYRPASPSSPARRAVSTARS